MLVNLVYPHPPSFFPTTPVIFIPFLIRCGEKEQNKQNGGREKKKSVRSKEGGGGVVHSLVRFCPPCIEMRRRENTRVPGARGTSKEEGKLPKMKYCGEGWEGRSFVFCSEGRRRRGSENYYRTFGK